MCLLLLAEAGVPSSGSLYTGPRKEGVAWGPGNPGVSARILVRCFASRPCITQSLVGADMRISPFLTVKLKQDAVVSRSHKAPVSQSVSQLTSR